MEKIGLISLFSLIIFTSFLGCKEQLVGENPPNTFEQNFESLWQSFDLNYPYFEHKKINWDSLYVIYRTQIDAITSNSGLYLTLSSILEELKDGHATLITPFATYTYLEWHQTFYDPVLLEQQYLQNVTHSSPFMDADIGSEIAYIHVNTFMGSNFSFKEIDEILEKHYSKKGLILDIRTNGGGKDINSQEVLARFASEKTLIRKILYRNGPNHSDFSKPILDYISPKGFHYDKKVVLITDQSVFSAAEDFVLGMRQLSNVTVLGEPTGGGSGNPATYDLPNGWLYTVSRWQILQPETDSLYEGIGLSPDVFIPSSPDDAAFLRDVKIEEAIRLILDEE